MEVDVEGFKIKEETMDIKVETVEEDPSYVTDGLNKDKQNDISTEALGESDDATTMTIEELEQQSLLVPTLCTKSKRSFKVYVMERRLKATPEQFSTLIEFMERHGDLSKQHSGLPGRIKRERLWQNLANILNSLGGGVKKSSLKWKKVWADWKAKTKKKYLSLRLQARGTDCGASGRLMLNELEQRVVAVIGGSAVVCQGGIEERGFNRISSEPVVKAGHSILLEDRNAQAIVSEEHSQNISTPAPTQPQPDITTYAVVATTTPASPASLTLPPQPPPSPPSSSPPPPQRTPPARNNRRHVSASPQSTASTPHRARVRRNIGQTPFERAVNSFTAVEQRRLEHEEKRDIRLHEREMERLRQEAERIEVAREQNCLLHQLSRIGQQLLDAITQQRPFGSLPSTDPM